MNRMSWYLFVLLVLGACRGAPPPGDDDLVSRLVDSLAPAVEKAAGLKFKAPPRAAVRSREQVRAYILAKLDQELTPDKARGLQATYRLLGLLPDSLDLRALMLELFAEQVVGYYEPDSSMLFVVAKPDPQMLRLTVAHELVHALQHQYIALDSVMRQTGNSDRLLAAQSILEGQATLAGMQVMVPEQNLYAMPEFWETYRDQLRNQQATMPVFNKSPRILRESVIFPYLAGADFLRWWQGSELRDTVPYGSRMPVSSEQILHPNRYGQGDQPVELRFTAEESGILYEDVMGEFDLRVLGADLASAPATMDVTSPLAVGWGGDRFRVYDTPKGPAMVWYLAWDDAQARFRWMSTSGSRLESRRRLGYRMEVTNVEFGARLGTRIVIGPEGWAGWNRIAGVEVVEQSPAARE
jgi:hypothetical protein